MIDLDNWQEIYTSLKNNKLRTLLTAFGVFWGILMLIVLLGMGKGMQNGMESSLDTDDRSSIWLSSSQTSMPYKGLPHGRKIQFTEDDLAAITRQIDGVNVISAENYTGPFWAREVFITHKNKSVNYGVYGVAKDFFQIKRYQDYRVGRRLNTLDELETRKVAVIGVPVAEALFDSLSDAIGKLITIHGVSFKVVGVFYDKGDKGRKSERVYIPMSTFQRTYGDSNELDTLTLTAMPEKDPFKLEQEVMDLLRDRHKISPDDTRALSSFNFAKQMKSMNDLIISVNAFIWFVGIGTLIAGIVGVSNVMIITVKDRTIEIGVRKALGATPGSIVKMIITESVVITAVAGYTGLVLGVAVLEGINMAMQALNTQSDFFKNPEVNIINALIAVVILVVSGALAGLMPALHAARIMPIEAMREG